MQPATLLGGAQLSGAFLAIRVSLRVTGLPGMAKMPPMDLFGALLFQVAGQQLSVAATQRTGRASGPSWRGISRHPPNRWAWSPASRSWQLTRRGKR